MLKTSDFNGSQSVTTIHGDEELAIVMVATIVVPSMHPSLRYYVTKHKEIDGEAYFYLAPAIAHFNLLCEK